MNAHLPQSYQTMEELRQLASVPTQIISPRECKPIISVVQDICLGLYRLTKSYVKISERQFFNLLMTNNKFNGIIPQPKHMDNGVKYWSGHQVLSMILPERVNVEMKSSQFDENKTAEENKEFVVSIKNGEIQSGAFDKDVYQARTRGVIHSVYNDYGPEETRQVYDHTQKLICDWLVYNGFSVGVSDLLVEQKTQEDFKTIIHNMKVKAYEVLHNIHDGKFENNSTHNNHTMFELQVLKILNDAIKDVGEKGLKNIKDENNRMINMIKSKSKGNIMNVGAMIGCVGQQNVDGKRIPYGFDDRTLPHYTKYDDGPESRGFVENSFIKGLTPQEFFFHAMGGREGLIDTAVQSVTGDTPLIIIEDGKAKYVNIGDWIDEHLDANKDAIKLFPEQYNMEYLKFKKSKKVYIQTCDNKGKVTWANLSAITRHDPSSEIYEITTESGRTVKVVDSKSLIVWDDEKKEFQMKNTSQLMIGDKLPTIYKSPEPPTVYEYLEMKDYFSKTEYLYGTDLHIAIDMMKKAMETESEHGKIRKGWWEDHNGDEFTTPFPTKARLQRFTVRSDNDSIKDGMVYNFRGTRGQSGLPDKFKLDRNFGQFIGYYLADGCVDHCSGTVLLSTINPTLQRFVQDWLAQYNITSVVRTREMKIGVTATVYGHSSLLCQFLDKFVGHGARNKYVPEIAFTGPIEFARGLIEGYFSGDGTVGDSDVSCSSTSPVMINGFSHLLMRFGIASKIRRTQQTSNNLGTVDIAPIYALHIRGDNRNIFAKQFELIKPDKQARLDTLANKALYSKNVMKSKNVNLDEVVSITRLDQTNYLKVYDVTVDSTLNFSMANGLIVHDTSEVGYTQRKLVKAMEDCKVNYDLSVRNAAGVIIQFLYGEDGMDACKLEAQFIPTIELNADKLQAGYGLVDGIKDYKTLVSTEIYKQLKADEIKVVEALNNHYKQILEDRHHMITKVFKNFNESGVLYPVAINRIITNVQNLYAASGKGAGNLSPIYILDTVNQLCEELCVNKSHKGNRLFQVLLRAYLSPKRILSSKRLTKDGFDAVVEQIRFRFFESLAQPSEMVGVVAAQSIGEPATQLVLNSFHMSGTAVAAQATRGVPRLNELLSVSKNIKTPIMKIFLHESIKADKRKCMDIMNDVRTIRFRDIVSSSKIYYDPDDFNTSITEDRGFINVYKAFNAETNSMPSSPWLLRLEVDRNKLLQYNIDMLTLHHTLDNFYDDQISCMFSDDNAQQLILRVKLSNNNKDESTDDALTDLKALEHNIMENVVIKGVKNIERVALEERKKQKYNAVSQTFEAANEWVINTAGSNLRDVLIYPMVNAPYTVTNDVNEVYETLGIEAARNSLYNEIQDVLESGSVSVNYRHIALLVDVMTNRGNILSVNRHGINRGDIGPLAKCSFEETTDKLIKAGIFAEFDKINGVSANVMLGQIAPCGTGDVQVGIDEEILSKIVVKETLVDLDDDPYDNDLIETACAPEAFEMRLPESTVYADGIERKIDNDVVFY